MYAQNPRAAMTLMDYFYDAGRRGRRRVLQRLRLPGARRQELLLHPTGWASHALKDMKPEIGLPTTVTADAPTVFPTPAYIKNSRSYYQYKSQEELDAWNNLFLPITQGA